jgi:hypothetical protein
VRQLGYSGFAKNAQPKMSQFRDEDWMSVFSYMFAMYEPSMAMDGKCTLSAAQKQAIKYERNFVCVCVRVCV